MDGAVVTASGCSPSEPQGTSASPFVSPHRKKLREAALHNLAKQGKRMKRMATLHSATDAVKVGTVVRISAPDVDRARGDPPTIVAVVVETTNKGLHRVATKHMAWMFPC